MYIHYYGLGLARLGLDFLGATQSREDFCLLSIFSGEGKADRSPIQDPWILFQGDVAGGASSGQDLQTILVLQESFGEYRVNDDGSDVFFNAFPWRFILLHLSVKRLESSIPLCGSVFSIELNLLRRRQTSDSCRRVEVCVRRTSSSQRVHRSTA